MRRSGTYRQEAGGSGNLYRLQFQTNVSEFSGLNLHNHVIMEERELEIINKEVDKSDNGTKMFDV